jgi:hypothetical protein
MLIIYGTNYKTTKRNGLGQWVTYNDMAIQKHLFEHISGYQMKKGVLFSSKTIFFAFTK